MNNKSVVIGGFMVGSIVVGIIALIVITAILAFSSIDTLIKEAIEEVGSKITKSTVKLDNVSTSLTAGNASLSGLTLGNPRGFNKPHSFKLSSVKVEINTETVTKKIIVINKITVDMPDVIAEFRNFSFNPLTASNSIQEAFKTSNFATIQKNIEASVVAKDSDGKAAAKGNNGRASSKLGDSGAKEGGFKFIIKKLKLSNVKVRAVSQSGLALDQTLPSISFSIDNIGEIEGGFSPEEVAGAIVTEVQNALIDAISVELTKLATDVFKTSDAQQSASATLSKVSPVAPRNSLERKEIK